MVEQAMVAGAKRQAIPWPVFGTWYEPSGYWVGFDIAKNIHEVQIVLDRAAPEALLKDVAVADSPGVKPQLAGIATLDPVEVRR
jgi:hypothetical protein